MYILLRLHEFISHPITKKWHNNPSNAWTNCFANQRLSSQCRNFGMTGSRTAVLRLGVPISGKARLSTQSSSSGRLPGTLWERVQAYQVLCGVGKRPFLWLPAHGSCLAAAGQQQRFHLNTVLHWLRLILLPQYKAQLQNLP